MAGRPLPAACTPFGYGENGNKTSTEFPPSSAPDNASVPSPSVEILIVNTRSSEALGAAKTRAQNLAARLCGLGVKITHGQSLEGLAAAEGFSDWNRLAAALSAAPIPPLAAPSVLLSSPGDGTSVVYRFHALNLLDRYPQDHVLVVSPFWFAGDLHCQRWRDKEERMVFEGSTTAWPALEKVKGKVLWVMPPPFVEGSSELSKWFGQLLLSWKRWRGYGRTRAFFGIDIHRYELGTLSGVFSQKSWPIEVRLFTQDVDSIKALAQPSLDVLTLTKHMGPGRRTELAQLEANVTLLSSQQAGLTDEAIRTYEGLVRFIASPLISPFERVSTGPVSNRLISFLEDETILYEEQKKGLRTSKAPR